MYNTFVHNFYKEIPGESWRERRETTMHSPGRGLTAYRE